MSRNGIKVNAASQFLREMDDQHLTIVTNVEVESLLYAGVNSTTIVGIEFRDTLTNATYHAAVIKEVLLADGAVRNAQLLMQSGIGPAEHLRGLDVSNFFQ
jgi:choline dehydrogenase